MPIHAPGPVHEATALLRKLIEIRQNGVGGRCFPALVDPDVWLRENADELVRVVTESPRLSVTQPEPTIRRR